MTDLHTHILPGMDDGAKDSETSLAMLRMQRDQGVDTVVLTPHFYRERELPAHFLERRSKAARHLAEAITALPEEERSALPALALGAEVAWVPGLSDWPELERLCLGRSQTFLLELPSSPWTDQMIHQLYDLPGRTGLTPIIAHLERYLNTQKRQHIQAVLSLGVPVQVSAEPLLHPFQRGTVLKMLREGQAQLLASDSHNLSTRKPNLGPGMEVVRRKLGDRMADSLAARSDRLLLEYV